MGYRQSRCPFSAGAVPFPLVPAVESQALPEDSSQAQHFCVTQAWASSCLHQVLPPYLIRYLISWDRWVVVPLWVCGDSFSWASEFKWQNYWSRPDVLWAHHYVFLTKKRRNLLGILKTDTHTENMNCESLYSICEIADFSVNLKSEYHESTMSTVLLFPVRQPCRWNTWFLSIPHMVAQDSSDSTGTSGVPDMSSWWTSSCAANWEGDWGEKGRGIITVTLHLIFKNSFREDEVEIQTVTSPVIFFSNV